MKGNPSILVVDDDGAVLEMLSDLLTERGYQVETCKDGRRVLPMLEIKRADLLLLDVLIPHHNGFAVLEQLRGHPLLNDLPVIMFSGIYRSRNHRSEMLNKHRVLEYLDKPLQTDKLLQLVEKAIGGGTKRPIASMTLNTGELAARVKKPLKPNEDLGDESLADPEAHDERRQVERDSRQRFGTSAFTLQGAVSKNQLAAVLGKLWHARRSGALLLKRGRIKKIVYLEHGDAYAVRSNLISECLGQVLVRERLISADDCARSLALMRETKQRQGEVLVDMRVITPRNLDYALELQLETKLFELFAWDDGDFRFNATADRPAQGVRLPYRGAALVTEGIRRAYDETRLRKLMLPILDVPLLLRDGGVDLSTIGLSEDERREVERCTLPQTTRGLIESSALAPPDTLRLVYTLIALELVAPRS